MGNKSVRAVTPAEKALQHVLTRQSTLRADMFALSSVAHHGLPSNTRAMTFCGLQGILAVGTASGSVKLYGADALEVLVPAPRSKSNLTVGVVHMKFTAQQRLIVTYTDSSIRLFNLATPSAAEVELPETWTTSSIVCIETITYLNFPFVFVALDDGNIHVIHEETGRVSTYTITPRDVGVTTSEADKHTQVVTAMASNPRDGNQLLIAYEASSTIYLWDFIKRKLSKDFTLTKHKHSASASPSSEPNSVLSISWHSSGKRFVAGFRHGGFGVFRLDKPHGHYHTIAPPKADAPLTPITRIHWMCAPPTSRHSHLPGAVIMTGGRVASGTSFLTVVFPPRELADEDAITAFVKSEQLTWQSTSVEPGNQADIGDFAVFSDQVDYCAKVAPFSVIMLSGNPLDGSLPMISVQCLPCFVRLRDEDKEDWEWIPDRQPPVSHIPPPLLQASTLKAFTTVSLTGSDGSLQHNLREAMDPTKIDPVLSILAREDFEWPINGGSVSEPLLKGFIPLSAISSGLQHEFQTATLIITGHANGFVLIWELVTPSERSSNGTIKLLHVVDVAGQLSPPPASAELSCLSFCQDSRTLVAGFAAGEVAVLEFIEALLVSPGEGGSSVAEKVIAGEDEEEHKAILSDDGKLEFRLVFSLHIHSSAIKTICFSSKYQYAAVADDAGVVSLIELSSRNYELLIFDISSDEPVSVESLLLSELVQVTEIPAPSLSPPTVNTNPGGRAAAKPAPRSPIDRRVPNSPIGDVPALIQHREIVPVLFVGRGNGKLEMFHVQSSKKIGEYLVDTRKASSLSSIIMVDTAGHRVEIRGCAWKSKSGHGDKALSLDDTISAAQIDVKFEPDGEHRKRVLPVSQEENDFTLHVLAQALGAVADRDIERIHNGKEVAEHPAATTNAPEKWQHSQVIETRVPAGSLGLHLYTEVEQHAIVKGFVLDNDKASALAAQGLSPGHAIVAINGVDLVPYSRIVVCSVLEMLRDREKVMVFAQGFGPLPEGSDPEVGSLQDALAEKPRFLICACGKSIYLVQAALPKASEIASGAKELPAQPLASIELGSDILRTAIIRVPIHDRVEHCLAVVDQSNQLYVISLLTLHLIWRTDFSALGNSLDGIHSAIANNGEVIVANAFGEVERYTIFAEGTARESAILERVAVKTRVLLEERKYPFDKEAHPSPKKKSGIAVLKKLVTGVKEAGDLNKAFHFTVEEDERRQLMGNRKSIAGAVTTTTTTEDITAMKKASEGAATTKEVLAQATQHLHERGEKLGDLALKTEQMKDTAEDFYKTMKAFNDKNANKKWYEF